MVVVFPAPLGPSRPKHSPRRTSRSSDLTATVSIRGEAMTALAAMHRGLAHTSQHVGQIVLLAKHYRSADWKTLSIPRGQSGNWQTGTPTTTR